MCNSDLISTTCRIANSFCIRHLKSFHDYCRCAVYSSESEDNNDSVQIIETSSVPNFITLHDNTSILSTRHFNNDLNDTSDESFLRMEKLVTDMCSTDEHYISLKDCYNNDHDADIKEVTTSILIDIDTSQKTHTPPKTTTTIDNIIEKTSNIVEQFNFLDTSNVTNEDKDKKLDTESVYPEKSNYQKITPCKCDIKENTDNKVTPNHLQKPNIFKTPANPSALKKSCKTLSAKKTPNKIQAYDHITSPIASYIKNSPQVPLITDIRPKKPLPVTSAIPKFVKAPTTKNNKENVDLPALAYRCAKETKVVSHLIMHFIRITSRCCPASDCNAIYRVQLSYLSSRTK